MTQAWSTLTLLVLAQEGGLALCVNVVDLETPPTCADPLNCFPLLRYFESFEFFAVVQLFSVAPLSTDNAGCLGALGVGGLCVRMPLWDSNVPPAGFIILQLV